MTNQRDRRCSQCSGNWPEQFTHCPTCDLRLARADGSIEPIEDELDRPLPDNDSEKHSRLMVSGALWAIGGTLVTAVTYNAAKDGGVYIIAWGAILFGALDFLRGLFGMITSDVGEGSSSQCDGGAIES